MDGRLKGTDWEFICGLPTFLEEWFSENADYDEMLKYALNDAEGWSRRGNQRGSKNVRTNMWQKKGTNGEYFLLRYWESVECFIIEKYTKESMIKKLYHKDR